MPRDIAPHEELVPLSLEELIKAAGKKHGPYEVIWAKWKGEFYPVLVSPKDYLRCDALKWFLSIGRGGTFYARATLPKELLEEGMPAKVSMHRFILDMLKAPRFIQVDHENAVSLDNRRKNLSRVLPIENMNLREITGNGDGGYRGVYRLQGFKSKKTGTLGFRSKPWRAVVSIGNEYCRHIGTFKTALEAAKERDYEIRLLIQDLIPLSSLNVLLNFPIKRKYRLARMRKELPQKKNKEAVRAIKTIVSQHETFDTVRADADIPF